MGRDRLVERLRQGHRQWTHGGTPVGVYLFGPRGVGKSHILALLREELASVDNKVTWIPEDIASIASADELLRRIEEIDRTSSYGAFGASRRILVIEGLDKRFSELGTGDAGRAERERLRSRWDGRDAIWLIGTGVELTSALTDAEEPFYGWFDVEPVEPLNEADAGKLLDALVSKETRDLPHWSPRRAALVALAGGSPRVLVSLGETCADPSDAASASDALLAAVDRFTPHYQMRFRDLAPQAQRIAEVLATAAHELNPAEIGLRMGVSPQTIATQARRLVDDGVLLRREDGRLTWYRLAEPLFRYWFEYRTSPWEATRVGIASRLLETLFSADEIVDAWWRTTNPDEASWLLPTVQQSGQRAAREKVVSQIENTPRDGERRAAIQRIVTKAHQARLGPFVIQRFMRDRDVTAAAAECTDDPLLRPTLQLAVRLAEGRDRPREVFRDWVEDVATTSDRPALPWFLAAQVLVSALSRTWGPGKPWTLTASEQDRLAKMPFVRGHLLLRGKLASHQPVLDPARVARHVRSTDNDLGDLLVAAFRRGNDDLVEKVLVIRPDRRPRLHANPVPRRPCPRRPDLLLRWATEYVNEPIGLRIALTWARTLADVDEAAFEAFLAAVAPVGQMHPGARKDDVQSALLALGTARPERLQRLVPLLGDVAAQVADLAEQLAPTGGARLHPELQRLLQAVSEKG